MISNELAAVPALDSSISVAQRKANLEQRRKAALGYDVEQQQALRNFLHKLMQKDENALTDTGLWCMRYDQTTSIPIAQENRHLAQMIYQYCQDKYEKYVSNKNVIAQARLYMDVSLFASENLDRALEDRVLYGNRRTPPAASVPIARSVTVKPDTTATNARVKSFLRPTLSTVRPKQKSESEARAAASLMALRRAGHFSPANPATPPTTGGSEKLTIVVTPASP